MPIEQVIVTSEQPTGREIAVDLAALRLWMTSELRRIDERYISNKIAHEDKTDLLERTISTRFDDQADNVRLALNAQKELNAVVTAASDKAIQKAEEAQRGVNERGNEFRAQLKDQNDTMIPRIEADNAFKNLGDRIDRAFKTVNETMAAHEVTNQKAQEDLRGDIIALREYNSRLEGRAQQQSKGTGDNRWVIGTIISAAALIVVLVSSGIFSGKAPTVVYQSETGSGGARPGGSVTDTRSTTTPK